MPSFYHDASSGTCQPFTYGGCEGNANRFSTRSECEATCGVVPESMFECTVSADCAVISPGCCGGCEPVQFQDLVGVNLGRTQDYADVHCPPPHPTCGACADVTPDQQIRANYAPSCVAGRCEVIDLRQTEYSDCSDGAACKLISNFGCCEGCGGGSVAAIRADVDPAVELACDEASVFFDCPACEPVPPPNATAVCNQNRCEVQWASVTEASCRVGDTVYPHGSSGIPDPFSCNTCDCVQGRLECTLIGGCDIPCPAGTQPGTSCDNCGPADECYQSFHGCLPQCDDSEDCAGMTFCFDGLCRMICG
jgi:hypothetical protein